MKLKKAEHLLVLRFSSLGDVAIMVPVLRCFFKKYPDTKITIATNEACFGVFYEFKNINVFKVEKKKKHKGILGLWRLFNELKNIKPTAIADLHSVLRTNILEIFFRLYFFKYRRIIKGRKEKIKLIQKQNKSFKPLTPTIFRYLEVFRKIGFELSLENHEFPPKPILPKLINKLFISNTKKWIGIAPFASFKGKVYPLDLMQKVIAYLQKENQIFLFGFGKREMNQFKVWEKAFTNVYSVPKELNLNQEICLMAHLDLMISMDSANGHMASNMGVKVITLWGLTHPFLGFSPWEQPGNNNIIIDRKNYPLIPTSVYGNKIPKGYENAFRSISPKQIIEKVVDLL